MSSVGLRVEFCRINLKVVRELLSGLTQVSSDVCMAKGLREELGMDEGGHSIHGEMCPMRGGSKLSTPCPGPKERTTTFVPSIPQQCFGHEQVSVQQGEGEEGWPQHEAGQGGRGGRGWGGRPGAEEPRGTETRRLSASAKCRGRPEPLEQHVSPCNPISKMFFLC